MSIMIDMPPTLDAAVNEYVANRRTTIGQLFVEYLRDAIRKERHGQCLMRKWRETVQKGRGRVEKPYKFNRADAYEPEVAFA